MPLLSLLIIILQQLLPVSSAVLDQYADNDKSEAFLVISDTEGCYYALNGSMKQIIFLDYAKRYDNNYSLFLSDLLEGNIVLKGFPHLKIIMRLKRMPLSKLIKRYLQEDQSGLLTFKCRMTRKRMITIMKIMFDNGYFVLHDDYRGEFFFSSTYPYYPYIEQRE